MGKALARQAEGHALEPSHPRKEPCMAVYVPYPSTGVRDKRVSEAGEPARFSDRQLTPSSGLHTHAPAWEHWCIKTYVCTFTHSFTTK